jgi:hypothetical protein
MLAIPELLHYDHMRFIQDASGMGRFLLPERESAHWPVKAADLMGRPSRRWELIDKIGVYALNGPADIHAKLRRALVIARKRIAKGTHPDDHDRIYGLRATAERALRMTNAKHWRPVTGRLPDGREFEGHQYQPPAEEIELRNAAIESSNASMGDLNVRLSLQKALTDPAISTAQIVAQGITWAKTNVMKSAVDRRGGEDEFANQWRERAVVMAAALAARDYVGADRAEVEDWSRAILQSAAEEENDDIASRTGDQVCSNKTAIAAVGYAGLYRKSKDATARDGLLALAARQDHPVLHAIGNHLGDFERLDARLPRSLVRLALRGAAHPRRTLEAAVDAANFEAHRRSIAEAVGAERRWLDGADREPAWPELPPWHSLRRRRSIRLGSGIDPGLNTTPDMYVDDHAVGILAGHLVPLTLGDVQEWVISCASRLMAWTVEANNGPPDDEHARDNRPAYWNGSFFDFLGVLCAALPFEQGRALFMGPITQFHDHAFHDAMASFLRGFDRATLAIDTRQPDNPVAVRALFAERLRRSRMAYSLKHEVSFRVETHLGDALNAMFFQQSRWANSGRAYIPDRWQGLLECMPVLTPIVTSLPMSGYLAVVFLTLVESFPCAALLPNVVQATSAWCKTHGTGANFWNEHRIGHRVCGWIDRTLSDDAAALDSLVQLRGELTQCLDVLVRSGVASARALEVRIAEDTTLKKTA